MILDTSVQNQELGQSVLEFLLLLPMLVSFTLVLCRVNTAIQVSIVNQQYARAQALFLAYNSSDYPKLDFQDSMRITGDNQIVTGVSDNLAPDEGKYVPSATVQRITRTAAIIGSDEPKQENVPLRAKVRIRNTVTLCAPSLTIKSAKGGIQEIVSIGSASNGFPSLGQNNLVEGSDIGNYCRSSMQYE